MNSDKPVYGRRYNCLLIENITLRIIWDEHTVHSRDYEPTSDESFCCYDSQYTRYTMCIKALRFAMRFYVT